MKGDIPHSCIPWHSADAAHLSAVSIPTPRVSNITKRIAPRLPNPPFGPAVRSLVGSRRPAASGNPSREGARLRRRQSSLGGTNAR